MPLAHAILAFLDYRPMTGYDLKKYFDQSVAHFWSATQSHIYKALTNLEARGWVESTIIPQQGRPNRKAYHLTAAGRAELRRWLTTPLPVPAVREAWLIQIFFSHDSSNEEIVALLQARYDAISARVQAYRQRAQAAIEANAPEVGNDRPREMWQISLDYGVEHYLFELKWLQKTMARVRELPHHAPAQGV